MKWKSILSLLAILILNTVVVAQSDIAYEIYTSEDGRVSFDAPEGWLITPFGPAFNISTQGWVAAADIQPGQQMVDIMTLNTADLSAGGIDTELPPDEYALAILQMLDDGSPYTIEGTSTTTLDSGIEAGVIDITLDPSRAVVIVYQQDNLTIFTSGSAHQSEFEQLEPIALHIVNSIQPGENAGQAPAMSAIPVVMISATDEEIQMPPVPEEGVPAGVYTFNLNNSRSAMPFTPIIGYLNEGVTMDDFTAALGTDDGLSAVFLVTLLGGSVVMPEQSISMTVELVPGEYMLLEISEAGPGGMVPFTVVENDAMPNIEAPVADVSLTLVNFAFGIQQTIPSGELLWHIENAGEQWHEAAIFSVPDGTTVDDIMSSFASGEEGNDEEFSQVYVWLPMSAGQEAWTTINLEPGTYAILCFLPDLQGDFSPHIAHGMVQVFTVE